MGRRERKPRESRFDRFTGWAKDHPLVSSLMIAAALVGGAAQFSDAVGTIARRFQDPGVPELVEDRVVRPGSEMENLERTIASVVPDSAATEQPQTMPPWWSEGDSDQEMFDFIIRNPGDSDLVITRLILRATRVRQYRGHEVSCAVAVPSWGYDVALDPGDASQQRSVNLAQVVPAGRTDRFLVFLGHEANTSVGAVYEIQGELVTSSNRRMPLGRHTVHVRPLGCKRSDKRDSLGRFPEN